MSLVYYLYRGSSSVGGYHAPTHATIEPKLIASSHDVTECFEKMVDIIIEVSHNANPDSKCFTYTLKEDGKVYRPPGVYKLGGCDTVQLKYQLEVFPSFDFIKKGEFTGDKYEMIRQFEKCTLEATKLTKYSLKLFRELAAHFELPHVAKHLSKFKCGKWFPKYNDVYEYVH